MSNPASPLPAVMTSWRQTEYGSVDVISASVGEVPQPGRHDVLVRVRATGLNAADVRIMRGDPALLRLVFGLRRPRVAVQGRDVCGTVVMVGRNVTSWRVGDEVVGEIGGGGLAEYVAAPASRFVRLPAGVDPVVAAALPLAGGTAVQALDAAGVEPGRPVKSTQRVLVLGAGGGVGSFAVRLATLRGAEVWALCGSRAEALIRELGAVRTFDYRTTKLSQFNDSEFDAIIDIAGTASLSELQRLLRPGGSAVLVAGTGEGALGPFPRMIQALLRSRRSRRIKSLAAMPRPAITAELLSKVAAGDLRPAIERTWPLEEARVALAHVDAGHTLGKVMVTAS